MSTPTRNVRIDDELWTDALGAARDNGDNLPDVIREQLRDYVAAAAEKKPRVGALVQLLQSLYPDRDRRQLARVVRQALHDIPDADNDAVMAYCGGWLAAPRLP